MNPILLNLNNHTSPKREYGLNTTSMQIGFLFKSCLFKSAIEIFLLNLCLVTTGYRN
jgi:hypothetical protein